MLTWFHRALVLFGNTDSLLTVSALLTESGGHLLLESGDKILLE